MARIYKNSLCTITSPSPDPTKPLFIERDPHLVSPTVLQLFTRNRSHSGTVRFYPVLSKWTGKILGSFEGQNDPGSRESVLTGKRGVSRSMNSPFVQSQLPPTSLCGSAKRCNALKRSSRVFPALSES